LRRAASTIVTLDEQADIINDGILLNNPDPLSPQWSDLPAFYHNGACTLSFADGHVELHRARSSQTQTPVLCRSRDWPIGELSRSDRRWFMERMTELR
jgi:prepilin-type processing-associated H-X9-DG protein